MNAITTTWGSGPVYWVFSNPTYGINVVKVDLDAEEVDDDKEEAVGRYLAWNVDDDNGNCTQDVDDVVVSVSNEDDLKKFTMEVCPSLTAGAVVLTRSSDKIRVWKSRTKGPGKEVLVVNNVKEWDLGNATERAEFEVVRTNLWVEGCKFSTAARDVALTQTFKIGTIELCKDVVSNTVAHLILDVDSDDGVDDENPDYLPGQDLAGHNLISNTVFQTVQLIVVAPGAKIVDTATLSLLGTSAYRGYAMNKDAAGYPNSLGDPDFILSSTAAITFDATGKAKVNLRCYDYGAHTTNSVTLSINGQSLTLKKRIPLDTDCDLLPDEWEDSQATLNKNNKDADVDGVSDAQEDDEVVPPVAGAPADGITGDGLVAFEEYRGFECENAASGNHEHFRASAVNKDLFVFANVAEGGLDLGLGYLGNSPLSVYRIRDNEWTGSSSKVINKNRDGIASATLQRALHIIDGALGGELGLANPGGIDSGPNGVCQTAAAGDDVQVIPVGHGLPNAVIITHGGNGQIEITLAGDDTRAGNQVKTGPDGIVQTAAQGDDVQTIPVGQGEANATIVTAGGNGVLDVTVGGDDTRVGNDIKTGPNGICETMAHGDDAQAITVGRGEASAVIVSAGANGTLDTGAGAILGDDVLDSIGGTIKAGPDGIAQTTAVGDDLQAIALGSGKADSVCVQPGANGILDPVLAGDDILDAAAAKIVSGPDGIAQTGKLGDDVQVIPVGNGKPDTVAINPGPNGILDPTLVGDDALNAGVPEINSGPDGIADTAAVAGDVQEIPVGQGMPNAFCVGRGPNFTRDTVALVGDDVAQDSGAGLFNESPNEHGTIVVDVTAHDAPFSGIDGLPGTADDVDLSGAANQPLRRDAIRESIAHEGGHGFHLDHYFGGGGHAAPWSVMFSPVVVPVPMNYDAIDNDQIRLHLKHP